ncbi:MAG: PIN domain nuclease [Actinobacteria bacterium]|nr:PIN domain nuclease [Actinomycetota bacterium]
MLIDTSAWVEFLRRTGSPTAHAVAAAVRGQAATTDVIVMEVLAGTTDPDRLSSWERAMDGVDYVAQLPRDDAEAAAAIYRACRRGGESPRQITDCLIAAVAIRCALPVLHHDRDFEVIARHTVLETVTA